MKRILILLTVLVTLLGAHSVFAEATPLPASPWYAVTWVQATDTLHWINANGEQASIPRPALDNQASLENTRLHISPDGRYLVVISPLLNGREGIGFFDLQAGQFIQTHETEPNEVFLQIGAHASSAQSSHIALSLRNQVTSAWRIILFEYATGDATHVLASGAPNLPGDMPGNDWWPVVVLTETPQDFPVVEVHFQMTSFPDALVTYPTYLWRALPNPAAVEPVQSSPYQAYILRQGIDINRQTGEVVYAWFDQGQGAPDSPIATNAISRQMTPLSQPTVLLSNSPDSPISPRWLNGGQWVGYYSQSDVFQPHPVVMNGDGSNAVPLGPNFIGVYHTPDGFLALDNEAWLLYHVTDLNFEGFSASFPSQVFSANAASFGVVYTTPVGATFGLTAVQGEQTTGQDVAIDGGLVAPEPGGQACPGGLAPRLTVGGQGMVSFTNGAPLNLRAAPNGDRIGQIAEGSVFNVFGGPQCVNNLTWWQVQVADDLSGWIAEGDADSYFVEPIGGVQTGPADFVAPEQPTQQPTVPVVQLDLSGVVVTTPLPPSGNLDISARPVVTPQPPVSGDLGINSAVNCPNSLPARVQVGFQALTVTEPGATLAMRANATDEFPTWQVPNGVLADIVGGPACFNGFRMWQVTLTLNGQNITGWLYEATQQVYYLSPVLP